MSIWVYLHVTQLYLYTPVLWRQKHSLGSDCAQVLEKFFIVIVGDRMAARGQSNT